MNTYSKLSEVASDIEMALNSESLPFTTIHNKYVFNIAGTCHSEFMPAWRYINVVVDNRTIFKGGISEVYNYVTMGFKEMLNNFNVRKEWVGRVNVSSLADPRSDSYSFRIAGSILPADKLIHDTHFHNKLMEEIDD